MRLLLFALGSLLLATTQARAQYELKAGNFNSTFVPQTQAGASASPSGPPNVVSPPPTASQFSGMGQVAGSAGPISTSSTLADRFASTPDNTFVLVRATFGGVFAAGVPRYLMGDEITPPLVQADGVTPAASDYWRSKPVLPGESFTPLALPVTVLTSSTSSATVTVSSVPSSLVTGSTLLGRTVGGISSNTITLSGGNANQTITAATIVSYVPPSAQTLFPLGTVSVTQAATNSTTVVVASVPPELVVGATLLGQPVTRVLGTTVTLAGPANTTITSATNASITPATLFYYSVHAEKTYASQPGRVTITWVTRVPNGGGNYEIKAEDFAVSSNTTRAIRTIFWTEGSFDGPKVQITDARITTVNPAFYNLVPKAVAEEVVIPGYTPLTPNLTTLGFDRFNGSGLLHAYNVEGRVLIEYLGNVRLAGVIHESVGIDVVDIKRTPTVAYTVVNLGKELTPHDGDTTLTASPVLSTAQTGANYYGTVVKPDNTNAYYAERETSTANDPDDGVPASVDAYNKVVFYWMQTGDFGIQWPKFQDRYWQRWSPDLADYAHYTVDAAGSTPATGIAFTGGALPQLVYQDDPAQTEAQIDVATQRFWVNLGSSVDKRNRSLLKFNNGGKVWYVNVYTQAETRTATRTVDANGTNTVSLTNGGSTTGLEVGMIVTGSGIGGFATIIAINGNTITLSQNVSTDTTYTFTVQSDAAAPIDSTATVGARIAPPAGHELAGQISSGTCYYPAGYLNPITAGVAAANSGAIIPVNALATDNLLTVRWFKKVAAPTTDFQDFYVPGKVGRYTVSYPAPVATDAAAHITIAGGVGTDDLVEPVRSGAIYYQNNSAQPGFNPNEEHALMLGGRAYALRDDLNTSTTSQPFVLVAYTEADDRPAMKVWKVRRIYDANGNTIKDSGDIMFDYPATAGTLLVKPYPLPLLPQPLTGEGTKRTSKDKEFPGADNPTNGTVNDAFIYPAYTGFTFKDRKGFTWVHRGPHAGGSGTLTMKLYYLSQAGFFVPGVGEPAVGTMLPFLRNAARSGQALSLTAIDDGQTDEPLPIIYRPTWPTNAPELRVAETLTLPKFGLPQVRGQASAEVLYQQSIALAATNTGLTKNSVTLHDSTREKTIALDAPGVGLSAVPSAVRTTSYQGRTYFQGLPPSLQERAYIDPLRGAKGTLVLVGEFHDETAGEDYLDLNLLTAAEEAALKNLVLDGADKSKWDAAIDGLNAAVLTFLPNPAQDGSYYSYISDNVGENDLVKISSPDTAVDSYAVTATGQGSGFVTMVFGNGLALTPEGDPVQVKVFKVAPQLYTGDLKVVSSSNPLDEQTSLRHSGDFAGKPEDYEFEWRWATGDDSAPLTYTNVMTKRIGDPAATPTPTHNWIVVNDPGALTASTEQITAAGAALPFPRSVNVRPTGYTDTEMAAGYPSVFVRSSVGVNFSTGVPGTIVFSADLGALDGCVLYVNGQAVLANNAPGDFFTNTDASTGLTTNGLTRQFSIAPSFFTAGPNTIEVAIYTQADPNVTSTLNFMLEAAQETDVVTSGVVWQVPSGQVTNTTYPYGANVTIGGSTANLPFGGPTFVLNDRWFTMRYRPKASANNVMGTTWSRWMPPQFVEGWIKRVLAAINPFEQRVKDLYNNSVNTDVSVITQAGARWEGDVALTLENINDAGLIAIYETVLNRAKSMSIDANTNDPDTNNALLLAAGYLSDLYAILGNEAYADAANPTISLDDQSTVTEVSTSRFSFEGQVASAVDEELALLRGRDDFVSPGVTTSPAYNRLYWNYTHGINGGEVIYAVNYNIKEQVGSSTANGVIDEFDAQRMYPQGHGDAYGHYLTAITGYYRLLNNANFTWTPRAEAVTVLGQPVTVDFQDERKFASAAANIARSAQQVVALTYRKSYEDDSASGWSHYRDTRSANAATGVVPRQGLDEWVSRSTQGAFFNWAMANALVPDVDSYHTGVQKIDRTTVPELPELVASAETFQTTIDNANARLNPLGLSPGAIAFDISPTELVNGKSHFEQIYDRALRSLVNAAGAFNQAAKMTRSLRYQQNQIDDYTTVIEQQEVAYVNQLIDIYGRPYSGEIGAGKLYAQGYDGPDLLHWFIVDRPTAQVDTSADLAITVQELTQINSFTGSKLDSVLKPNLATAVPTIASVNVTVKPSNFVQYKDTFKNTDLGSRAETGELQNALLDAQQSWLALYELSLRIKKDDEQLRRFGEVFLEMTGSHLARQAELGTRQAEILNLERLVRDLSIASQTLSAAADTANDLGSAIAEFFPKVLGLAADGTSGARGAAVTAGIVAFGILKAIAISTEASARFKETNIIEEEQGLAKELQRLQFKQEEVQLAYEYDNLFLEARTHAAELMQLALAHQRALQNVNNVIAKGLRILEAREIFRQRAAAIIQGYRTKDLTFRIFRNEALEQYRSLFDLASRYTYLAAKSYDYETGLLGTTQGQTVFSDIVAARSLGDVTAGTPLSTVSSLGDDGLAGVMAKLNADFSVVEGRLGINNPDQNGTVFSLRGELFRILRDDTITSDDDAWRQTLEQHMVANVLSDSDVATYCMNIRKPDGTPVPGIIIPFSSSILHGKNFFGLDTAAGDHNFSPSTFATKIYSVGIALPGYVGMDTYAAGNPNGAPNTTAPNALNATPYCYLIPCGADSMRAPALGDTNVIRSWTVHDQALPLPYNLGATDFNSTQFFNANGTLSSQPWIIRKHQAFRPVDDPTFFYSSFPAEFTNSRLIGRSVWNGQWKIVIPAYTLLSNEQTGLDRFAASVKDVLLFLRTYSHSGN